MTTGSLSESNCRGKVVAKRIEKSHRQSSEARTDKLVVGSLSVSCRTDS